MNLSLFVYCFSEIKPSPGVFIYWHRLLFRFALQTEFLALYDKFALKQR